MRTTRLGRIAAIIALVAVTIVAAIGIRLHGETGGFGSASLDSLQWELSQLEVDLLRLADAADVTAPGGGELEVVRRRFGAFSRRFESTTSDAFYGDLLRTRQAAETIRDTRDFLRRSTPIVNGSDETLAEALPELLEDTYALAPSVRALTLEGVRVFSRIAEERRTAFEWLLATVGLMAAGLILLLAVTLMLALRRSAEVTRNRSRLSATIESSLDPIVVTDGTGAIVEFNEAAERVFGYPRDKAIGRAAADLIVPERHRAAFDASLARHLRDGETATSPKERFQLAAIDASGREFPVEVSIGVSSDDEGVVFIAYIRDIAGRLADEQALKAARDHAMAADRAKSDFIAVMSHEMRTPLNGMLGLLDLLDHTDLDPQQRKYVTVARRSGDLLLRQINDVLDLSQIGANKLKLSSEPLALAEIVEGVVDVNLPIAQSRGLSLTSRVRAPGATLLGDPHRLRQVLMNLVGNAVKFTRAGSVTVEAGVVEENDTGATVEFSVEDTGIGIEEGDLKRIFDDFVTLDPSYNRATSGTGLGLAICRRLVEAMGGKIGATSVPGKGSRFWVRLTLPAAECKATLLGADTIAGDDRARLLPLNARRVLLVEDNEVNRFVAREMLEGAGLAVDEAHDGLKGVEMAALRPYNLILMDISMPVMDGIEATRRIRSRPGPSRDAVIVGITAHALPEERKRFAEAGIQEVLLKPVRMEALLGILAKLDIGPACEGPRDEPADIDPDALLDEDVLSELAAQMPPEKFGKLVERVAREIRGGIDNLAGHARQKDLRALGPMAHKLAGTAALVGASGLHASLTRIETACRTEQADDVMAEMNSLGRLTAATLMVIREFASDPAAHPGEDPLAQRH